MPSANLQPVLSGGNGKATDLDLFLCPSGNNYLLYLGPALIERINCDERTLEYKIMVGRLYNAGWIAAELSRHFNHDPRTFKKWGEALQSSDPDFIIRAFSGRGFYKKMTPAAERFICSRYQELKGSCRDYRQRIVKETTAIFKIEISCEILRQIFRRVDQENKPIATVEDAGNAPEAIEVLPADSPKTPSENAGNMVKTCHSKVDPCVTEVVNDKYSPNFEPAGSLPALTDYNASMPEILHHTGLIFFTTFFEIFGRNRGAVSQQQQWIAQILQGAVNVEQSRNVTMSDIARFSGSYLGCLNTQRAEIHAAAEDPDNFIDIYKANNRLLCDGPGKGDCFYFDPTSKAYTGAEKLLKGWCGSLHGIAKITYLDSMHTASGRPCFIAHFSPYYDMRERFFMMLAQFNELFAQDKRSGRTFIIDRGIFGIDTFAAFDNCGDYLLTWEKDYKKDGWDDEAATIEFVRHKSRNSKKDTKNYCFSCQEQPWDKRHSWRRLLVRATGPKGETVQLSILCSNPHISLKEAVWLMFNRWLQENNFKYLNKHFGLGQITSYKTKEFAAEAENFRDKEVDSIEYRELKKQRQQTQDSCGKKLFASQQQEAKLEIQKEHLKEAQKELTKNIRAGRKLIEETLKDEESVLLGEIKVQRRELRQAKQYRNQTEKKLAKQQEKLKSLDKEVDILNAEYHQLDEKLENALRKQSRLELLVAENYLLADTRAKAYFDALRVTAFNMFANLADVFRPLYRNHRDDHAFLRQLTRADGRIEISVEKTVVHLWLKGSFQKNQTKKMTHFIQQIQAQINQHFGDSIKPLEIILNRPKN
jgi:hypothetical protein